MMEKHQVDIPIGICSDLTEEKMETMINVALSLEPLWENALGKGWKSIMTRDKLRSMYIKM